MGAEPAENIRCPFQFDRQIPVLFLNLFIPDLCRAIICHGGGLNNDVLVFPALGDRLIHLSGAHYRNDLNETWWNQSYGP